MHYYWNGGAWGGWMIVHAVFWIVLLALLIVGALAIARGYRRDGGGPGSALDLLNERYARGEIDREEYLQRKKDISER
jgi:putative membrane protein